MKNETAHGLIQFSFTHIWLDIRTPVGILHTDPHRTSQTFKTHLYPQVQLNTSRNGVHSDTGVP